MDERVRELTKELICKAALIDQLSDQLESLQNEKIAVTTPHPPEAPTIIHQLHEKTHLANLLTHSLITTRRVLLQNKTVHGDIRSEITNCFLGLEMDMKELLRGVSRYQGQAERERKKWQADTEEAQLEDQKNNLEREREKLATERLEEELKGHKAELEKTQGRVDTLDGQTREKDAVITDLEARANNLQYSIDAHQSQQDQEGQNVKELTESMDKERKARIEAEGRNQELLGDLKLTQMNLEQAEEKLSAAKDELKGVKEENAALNGQLTGLESKADDRIGGLTKEVNDKNAELERVRGELTSELSDARNSARTAAQKREDAMELLEGRLDSANKKIADLNDLLSGEREGRGDGEKEAEKLREELKGVTKDLGTKTKKLGIMEGVMVELKNGNKKFEEELSGMKSSMVKMSENLDESRNKEKDIRAEVRGLKAENDTLRQSAVDLEEDKKGLRKEVEGLREELGRGDVLRRGMEKEARRLGGIAEELEDKVRKLEDEASKKGETAGDDLKSAKEEATRLAAILVEKDKVIVDLQSMVHRECMERTAILEKLKVLQQGGGDPGEIAAERKVYTPTTPPKEKETMQAQQQWTGSGRGRGGRGRGGRNGKGGRGRRKGGTFSEG